MAPETEIQRSLNFDGATIEPCDIERLNGQMRRVVDVVKDGKWRTLAEIRTAAMLASGDRSFLGDSEAAISARLRDCRKARFGKFQVDRRRKTEGSGLFEYRVTKGNQC